MTKYDHKVKIALLILGDTLLLYAALIAGLFLRYYPGLYEARFREHFWIFTVLFALWILIFGATGLYDLRSMKNNKRFWYRIMQAMVANVFFSTILLYLLISVVQIEPRRNLLIIAGFATLFIFLWRYAFNFLIIKTPSWRVMFLGINKEIVDLADFLLKNPQLGQKPVVFTSANDNGENQLSLPHISENHSIPHLTTEKNIQHTVRDFKIDTVVITREIKENKTLVKMLFETVPLGVTVVEFSAYYESFTGKIPASFIGEIWFLENLVGGRKKYYAFFKRGMDILLAILFVIPSLILFPIMAAAIKLESEGSVFFRQKRVGMNGKIFELIKFRSMVKDAEKISGHKGKRPDPRHTRIGSFLRKNYLDEIPQIINVLRGEMSFIGPRPERPEFVENLKQKLPFYEMRLVAHPGITGWAQIHMENDASVEDAPEKMQYDLYYIKNRSFMLDLLIAVRTALTILRRQGR